MSPKSKHRKNLTESRVPPLLETLERAGHGTWIEIRLDRLTQNLRTLRTIAGTPHCMAVIKANAYGHGLLETARAIQDEVTYLGVSSIYEVMELREHGIQTPIFLFGRFFGQELVTAVKSGVTLSLSSLEEAAEISKISISLGQKTRVHVKVDTGMGRLGIPLTHAFEVIKKIVLLEGLNLEGLYTHFATSDKEDGFMESQFQAFGLLAESLEKNGISFFLRHAANSAANLRLKSPILNMARPGLALYGLNPGNFPQFTEEFAPVLSLKSRVILVKRLEAGESAGYGRNFVAQEPTTIATLPIGYSHGYSWNLSGKAEVLYKGRRYPLAGRVSMDYSSVNFGDAPVKAGDVVTLIGDEDSQIIRAEELAKAAGTISYEVVTRLSPRLPRIYC